MTRKIHVEFSDRLSGWSETYYFADGAAFNAKLIMQDFRDKRLKVLGAGCFITAIKVSQTQAPKVVHLTTMEREGQARDDPNEAGNREFADQSSVCVLMPYLITGGGKRIVTLRGVPDNWLLRTTAQEGFQHLTDAAVTNLNTFYNYLLAAPSLQARVRDADGNFAKTAITAIAEHESGRYQITSTLAANLAIGDKVTLTKLSGNNLVGMGGQRKVTQVIGDTSFTIDRGPRADLGTITYLGGAFAQKVNYEFAACSESFEPYGISTRKSGRPFSQRRGRRSAKR